MIKTNQAVDAKRIDYQYWNSMTLKVNVCHDGHTVRLIENAVASHLAPGDYVGLCVGSRANPGSVERK